MAKYFKFRGSCIDLDQFGDDLADLSAMLMDLITEPKCSMDAQLRKENLLDMLELIDGMKLNLAGRGF